MDAQANDLPVQNNAKYKLWEGLKEKKLYTKGFSDFEKQFSTESAIGGLHDALQQRKLYSKSKDDFSVQFFPEKVEKTKEGKISVKKEDTSIPLSEQPKLGHPELFSNAIIPIADNVYNKSTANIINKEKLSALLPKVKEQKVKDLAIGTLLSQNKLALEGSNTYKETYDNIMRNIKDEDWMPSWAPTSAQLQFSPRLEKEKQNAIDRFAESVGETADEVRSKIKNGDYEYNYKSNKVVTKGGFGDMAAYGLNNFFDKWRLYVDAAAAQERGIQKGNDNELKYVINQHEQLKKKQREFVPQGDSDIAKWANGQGQMIGELGPYVLFGPTGASGAVMGIQTGGGAIEDIINQPGTLDEKAARIKGQLVDQTMLGFAQDAAFKLIHVNDRNSAKELMAQYGPTKKLYNTFKEVMRVAPSDAVKAGMVGVGSQVIDNLYKSNDGMKVEWDIPQAFIGGATLDLMMKSGSVLTHGFSVLKNALKFNLDKTNPEWFNRYSHDTQEVLNHIVSSPNNIYDKVISMLDAHPSEDAAAAKEKIEAFRNHYNSLPKELSKATKFDALHLLQMKTEALAEAGSAADVTLKNALLKKATKIDEVLQKVIEGEDVDKKQPLLLPRFAQSYNREDDEAKGYGFKDAKDFLDAYYRRQGGSPETGGEPYKKISDIPQEKIQQFVSELVPAEQPKIDTTIPDWFVPKTEKTNAYASYADIKKNFPELHKYLSEAKWKFNDEYTNVKLKDTDNILGHDVKNKFIVLIETSMPDNAKDFALQIKAAEQAEQLLSYYQMDTKTMTKEDVKSLLEKPGYRGENKFTPEEVEIMQDMVDRLKTDNVFVYDPQAGQDKHENFYQFANNILKSKKPDAFIHEIGHWGYFQMLTPEERIEFMRYAANRFGTRAPGRREELVHGQPIMSDDKTSTRTSNAMWDFQEYFADQFRQYYYSNVLPEPKLRNIFEKVKRYINTLLGLYKEKGYNPELTKYFDKIIDASTKMGEGETLSEQKAREAAEKQKISEEQKQQNLSNATPEDLQAEFQKIKEKNDARAITTGITKAAEGPTGRVSSELAPEASFFRAIEPTEGQREAINEWTRRTYGSEGELDIDYGRNGLSKYRQTREEFIRSRFCK